MKDKVVIIGSGLGGLECGYILARHGFDVIVLERAHQVGGCLQSFRRHAATFDTGFHYVGGLDEGQPLNRLFRYFDLLDLPWHRLDPDCFDEVIIGGESFPFASGHERFAYRLAEHFPAEREGIRNYTAFLKSVGDHIFDSFSPREASDFFTTSLFARSAHDFLCETIHDPLLRKVLSGTSLKMELSADSLPLYVYAQINNSFIQSAWRLHGGGSQIAEHLAASIRAMGGRVLTNSEVTSVKIENGRAARVCVGSEEFEVDWVISDAHPATTVNLVEPSEALRKIYRKRMTTLNNTFGMFTANIALPDKILPYLNRNIFIHTAEADLWHPNPHATESLLVSYAVPDGEYARSVDLLSPMSWEEVRQWAELQPGQRGEEYADFKRRKLLSCIELAASRLPELADAVVQSSVTCSTPITYNSYLGAPQGSAYGVRKDWQNTMGTVLAPLTPIPNLLLTGQSLNLHGVLGVSMTSVFTCAAILGMETLSKEILAEK